MTDKRTGRGWEWTQEQREAIKQWYRALDKKHREVKAIVKGTSEALPEFAVEAERYAMPFTEQAEELLCLDSRRKGRKWQHIPFSTVPEKLQQANHLYEEYRECFLSREDFQGALREHNKGVRKHNRAAKQANRELVDQVVTKNLAVVEELRTSRENREVAVRLVREDLNLVITLTVDINLKAKLPESEVGALHRWLAIQYIRIAASLACEVRDYTRERVQQVDDLNDLLPDAHYLLVEHDIRWYNNRISQSPELFASREPGVATTPSFAMIVNTIQHRLQRDLLSHSGKLPSQLDFSLFGRDFGPVGGEETPNNRIEVNK